MKITYSKIKEFVIKHHILLIVVLSAVGAVVVFFGLIAYNESAQFCYSCHINEGPYHYINKELPAHKNIDESAFSCIKCHKDKTVQTIYYTKSKKLNESSQLVANLKRRPVANPKAVYHTEQCLICHPDRLSVVELEPYLMKSEKLQKIGLSFNKRVHYRFELFNSEDQLLYEQLSSKASLSVDEKNELQLLEKIKTGNCAQCHMQKKLVNNELTLDKGVNFIARNPISCAGCHEDATTIDHPGKPLVMPSKEICRKCHHGKIHGRFRIFKADCDDKKETEHCIKCHPYIDIEKE